MLPTQSHWDRCSAFPHLCFVFFISLLKERAPFTLLEAAYVSRHALPTTSNAAQGEEDGFGGVSLRHVSPGCCLKVCFKPVQRRRCCLRPPGRSWGRVFCMCRRSSAETDGDRSISSRPGTSTAAALGELVPPAANAAVRAEHQGGRSLPGCCPPASASLSLRLLLTFSSLASVYSTNSSLSDTEGLGSQMCRGARHREAVTR